MSVFAVVYVGAFIVGILAGVGNLSTEMERDRRSGSLTTKRKIELGVLAPLLVLLHGAGFAFFAGLVIGFFSLLLGR